MDRMDKLTTLFESDEQLYFCVGLIILVGAIVIICAMVNDYGSPDKPGGLSIQLCKSEKKEFYIRYSGSAEISGW